MKKSLSRILVVAIISAPGRLTADAQAPLPASPPVKVFGQPQVGAAPQTVVAPQPSEAGQTNVAASPANDNAERETIWNSPNMLRARAWLKDYCSKSAKVTPEMAQQYEDELANMTPNQMRIWLMKFDEEEEQRKQQYAMFQQHNQYMMQQALAAHRQTQQAYNAINEASTEAAQNAQQEIDVQREQARAAEEDKQLNQTAPYPYYGGPYGYGAYGLGPFGIGGYGGTHYHYHLYGR